MTLLTIPRRAGSALLTMSLLAFGALSGCHFEERDFGEVAAGGAGGDNMLGGGGGRDGRGSGGSGGGGLSEEFCEEGCDAGGCEVVAKDEDGDGHGSARCSLAPGDDCDDDDPQVYKGAPEICDGKVNNCDGRHELNELPVGGTSNFLLHADQTVVDAVWSEASNSFVIAYATNSKVYVAFVKNGQVVGQPITVADTMNKVDSVRIVPRGNHYGVAWSVRYGGIYFAVVQKDVPQLVRPPGTVAGAGYHVRFGFTAANEHWNLYGSTFTFDHISVRRLAASSLDDKDAKLLELGKLFFDSVGIQRGPSGIDAVELEDGRHAVAYTQPRPTPMNASQMWSNVLTQVVLVSADFAERDVYDLADQWKAPFENGYTQPHLATQGSHLGAAWSASTEPSDPPSVYFRVLNTSSGAFACAPTKISDFMAVYTSNGAVSGVVDVQVLGGNYAVLGLTSDKVAMHLFSPTCERLTNTPIILGDRGENGAIDASLALAPTASMLVHNKLSDQSVLHALQYRLMGPHLCAD